MMRTALRLLCAGVIAVPGAALAQPHALTLRVTDSLGTAVPFVSVTYPGNSTITDRDGTLRIPRLPTGRMSLGLRRIGFTPERIDLDVRSDTVIHIVMNPFATTLQTQVITARSMTSLERAGFYDRMLDRQKGLNNGYFVTPEEIEQRKPTRLTQMLHEIPNVRVNNVPNVGAVPQGSDACAMTIFVDGVRVQTYATSTSRGTSSIIQRVPGRGGPTDVSIDDLVGGGSVAAIEIYPRAASAPQRYQLLAGSCGIVAVWTKG
jgi:hypothetical protein